MADDRARRTLSAASWPEIEALRTALAGPHDNLVDAAQNFTSTFFDYFSTIVLARMFMVVPFGELPARDRDFALRLVGQATLAPDTPVLSLLASRGLEAAWNDRHQSRGHLAIPLRDETFVNGAPMIASLLAELGVDVAKLVRSSAVVMRAFTGGANQTFYVDDALTARDGYNRAIIDRDFTTAYGIRSVFGMGGSYINRRLTVAIFFTNEPLSRPTVDRFPSFIGSFKIATSDLVSKGRIYPE